MPYLERKYTPYQARVKHIESIRLLSPPIWGALMDKTTQKQSVRDNSDAANSARILHPTSPGEVGRFQDRLEIIVKGRSSRSFARDAGVSETVFRKYLSGASEPTRPALVALARAGGVNVGWLAAGDGVMRGNAPQTASDSASQPLRRDDLKMALQLAAEALGDKVLPPDKHAELVTLIYELLEDGLPEAKVLRFARLGTI